MKAKLLQFLQYTRFNVLEIWVFYLPKILPPRPSTAVFNLSISCCGIITLSYTQNITISLAQTGSKSSLNSEIITFIVERSLFPSAISSIYRDLKPLDLTVEPLIPGLNTILVHVCDTSAITRPPMVLMQIKTLENEIDQTAMRHNVFKCCGYIPLIHTFYRLPRNIILCISAFPF